MIMERSNKAVQVISIILVITGMIFSLVLTAFALWPDFEASLFDTNNANGEKLTSLRCPLIITPADQAAIRVTLENPLDKPVNFLVFAHISQGFVSLIREEDDRTTAQAGETVTFSWPVNIEDAAYGRMILARVRVLRTAGTPARQQSCGIMVLNVPFLKGNQVTGGLLVSTLLYLGVGAILWFKNERPLTGRKRDFAQIVGGFALLLLMTMFLSLIGWWGGGFIIILGLLLLIAASIERLSFYKRPELE